MTTHHNADGSGTMFDRIAPRYDLLNRLMSLGMDQRWRRQLVTELALPKDAPATVLDVATGTADIALSLAEGYAQCQIVGLDPSAGMLEVGRQKVSALGLDGRVELIEGDAQDMHQLETGRFDGTCIAFGIRNVPNRLKALQEMARVTRSGGRVVVLELGEPRKGLLAPFARLHVHHVVPRLGSWLSGDAEYAYLQKSIQAFPPAEQFAALMEEAGLDMLSVVPFAFGAANLYVAGRR